jgi:uncharacterized protein YbcV (DUF1398 family)
MTTEMAMNLETRAVAHDCAIRSHEGSIAFPAVVQRLRDAGVERYHADLQRGVTTYYAPDGGHHAEALLRRRDAIAGGFSGDAVKAALKAVQDGEIGYQQFVDRVMAAGCIGYTVFIAGRHVVYSGRAGEQHVEHFPPFL